MRKQKEITLKVTYKDHFGSDNSVVDAARVSFSKEASGYTPEQNNKLIKYLAKHQHKSPFFHTAISLHLKMPIFVARQIMKHTTGIEYNEVSRRYVDSEPEFYVPDVWRKKADNVKQGSSDEAVDIKDKFQLVERLYGATFKIYMRDVALLGVQRVS